MENIGNIGNMKNPENKVPEKEYKKILEIMPIPCVDMVISDKGRKRALLLFRNDEPFKGLWWVAGGRIFKNEKLNDAVIRLAKRETGLDVKVKKKIGSYELMYDKAPFGVKTGSHALIVAFLAEVKSAGSGKEAVSPKLDSTNSEYRWITRIEENLHPYIKQLLKDSRIFDSN